MKATIIAITNNPGEIVLAKNWIEINRNTLSYISNQNECGCCVMGWDIEGPEEVIISLPNILSASSDWASS